jgi:hypothetical protein
LQPNAQGRAFLDLGKKGVILKRKKILASVKTSLKEATGLNSSKLIILFNRWEDKEYLYSEPFHKSLPSFLKFILYLVPACILGICVLTVLNKMLPTKENKCLH